MSDSSTKDNPSRIEGLKSRRSQVEAAGFKAEEPEDDRAGAAFSHLLDQPAKGSLSKDERATRLIKFLSERRGRTKEGRSKDGHAGGGFLQRLRAGRGQEDGSGGKTEDKDGGGGRKVIKRLLEARRARADSAENGPQMIKQLIQARQGGPKANGDEARRERLKALLQRLGKDGPRR